MNEEQIVTLVLLLSGLYPTVPELSLRMWVEWLSRPQHGRLPHVYEDVQVGIRKMVGTIHAVTCAHLEEYACWARDERRRREEAARPRLPEPERKPLTPEEKRWAEVRCSVVLDMINKRLPTSTDIETEIRRRLAL